ncbi:hypothetical protein [Streptomyces sp. NPDC001843]|uniref:hypothetical protein n=1 Tax=Streptomyces sp. NPDC001843 TaxID=3364617 RepID=UPI0036C42143
MKALVPLAAAAVVLGSQALGGVAVAAPALGNGSHRSVAHVRTVAPKPHASGKIVSCNNQSTFNLIAVPAPLAAAAAAVTPTFVGAAAAGSGPSNVSNVNAPSNNPSGNSCS